MDKQDIVYILGSGSRWSDREIKYSVRSVEKNLKNYGKIFVVGRFPRFFDKTKIIHIQAEDKYGHKLKNAIGKIMTACRDRRLSESFILMNDDFFFLKRTDDIGLFKRGTLKYSEDHHETKAGYYYKAIADTRKLLQTMGFENPDDFEVHYPIIFEKRKFLQMATSIDFQSTPFLFRSVYCNKHRMKGKYRNDPKLYSMDDFEKCKKAEFFSTDNAVVLDNHFQSWIAKRFHEKSSYETLRTVQYHITKALNYGGRQYNPGDIVPFELPPQIAAEYGFTKPIKRGIMK